MHDLICFQSLLSLFVLVILCTATVIPSFADVLPDVQVKDAIDKALNHPYMANGVQGVLVQSLDTGKVIYDHNGNMLLTPASNMKLIATSAALDLLGADYKMTTSLYATSRPVDKGILKGDLVLVGQGDPILKIEHLQQMMDKLKETGVKAVDGNIVGDDMWFDDQRMAPGWAWEDEQYYDASLPSGLNVNENYVEVYIKPGAKVGDPAIVELKPNTNYMTIKNECVTGLADSSYTADATRLHGLNTIRTYGSIPLGCKRDASVKMLSMEEPTLFVCTIFKELLQKNGIKVSGHPIRGIKPDNAVLIATHDSPKLPELVNILNKPSDNFMAECLLKTLGKEIKGEGSYDAGKKVEYEWLNKIGADTRQLFIADSSGLSRCDLISPRVLVAILNRMYHTEYYETLANSLPIAGVDSHLKDRMLNTPAVNNVKAKTGYIERVCSLTGYVKTLAGEQMAVSIIQNNHMCSLDQANEIQDMIFVAVSKITTRTDATSN